MGQVTDRFSNIGEAYDDKWGRPYNKSWSTLLKHRSSKTLPSPTVFSSVDDDGKRDVCGSLARGHQQRLQAMFMMVGSKPPSIRFHAFSTQPAAAVQLDPRIERASHRPATCKSSWKQKDFGSSISADLVARL